MREAAKALGVTIPKTRGAAAEQQLLGAIRLEMAKRMRDMPDIEKIECVKCLELATEDIDYCPYCGDLGKEEGEAPTELAVPRTPQAPAAEAATQSRSPTVRPSAKPGAKTNIKGVGISGEKVEVAADVEQSLASVASDLDECLDRIRLCTDRWYALGYDIGIECKAIRDRQLFKARGYPSFKAFAEKELPFTRESALQLVSIVEKHSRQEYEQIGYTKLRLIAAVPDAALKQELLEAAKQGASRTELAERVTRASQRPEGPGGAAAKVLPEPGEKITLIGKIGARAQTMKFHDAKSREVVKVAGVFKSLQEDVYGELEISDGVFARIGLRINAKKELEALTFRIVRAAEDSE